LLRADAKGLAATSVRTVEVSIASEPRQTFQGFGVAVKRGEESFATIPDGAVSQAFAAVYSDLGVDVLRFFVPCHDDVDAAAMVADFRTSYLATGELERILEYCRPIYLLAPSSGGTQPGVGIETYAARIAETVSRLAREDGILMSATGLANEPESWTPAEVVEGVKALRRALDARGLARVGIVAPEFWAYHRTAVAAMRALREDGEAWAALRGLASHSYQIGTGADAHTLAGGKEYWVTEAGGGLFGLEDALSTARLDIQGAPTVAARLLADLNHGATHWLWFIGVRTWAYQPGPEASLALARKDGGVTRFVRTEYLRHALAAFPRGSRFAVTSSSAEGAMVWTYGRKPALTAAAAFGPDGRLRIGVVNATGLPGSRHAHFHERADIRCTLRTPVRKGSFSVRVTDESGKTRTNGAVGTDSSGLCRMTIKPSWLVTLVQA
jgi:hypothetical protein